MDGLAHGACAMMPGSGLVDVNAEIFRRYDAGNIAGARDISYSLQPYLVFALQHLELGLQLEKRVLVRRGVFPSDRMRRPTLQLDEDYEKQMDELVGYAIGVSREVRKGRSAST